MRLEAVPGVEIHIDCNGASLQEYTDVNNGDRRENQKTALRFIEALSGHPFQVTFQADSSEMERVLEDHVAMDIRLDGKVITGKIYRLHRSRISYNECEGVKSDKNGQTVLQRFTFGDLLTVDEQLYEIQKEDVERLGEIQVDLAWVRKIAGGLPRRSKVRKPPVQTNSTTVLSEKALKGRAISIRASLGEAEPIESVKNTSAVATRHTYPHGRESFATFIFKYRSRKDLQIEGVVARNPDPVLLEERDPANMSAQEMRGLITTMRARQDEVKVEKRKHSTVIKDEPGDVDEDEVEITEFWPAKRMHQSFESTAEVEIVDLTDL